jgi:hypothetical protein
MPVNKLADRHCSLGVPPLGVLKIAASTSNRLYKRAYICCSERAEAVHAAAVRYPLLLACGMGFSHSTLLVELMSERLIFTLYNRRR